jgi:hypothetical protein
VTFAENSTYTTLTNKPSSSQPPPSTATTTHNPYQLPPTTTTFRNNRSTATIKVELQFCRFELQLHLGHQSCRAISLYNVYLSVRLGPIWKPTLGLACQTSKLIYSLFPLMSSTKSFICGSNLADSSMTPS